MNKKTPRCNHRGAFLLFWLHGEFYRSNDFLVSTDNIAVVVLAIEHDRHHLFTSFLNGFHKLASPVIVDIRRDTAREDTVDFNGILFIIEVNGN